MASSVEGSGSGCSDGWYSKDFLPLTSTNSSINTNKPENTCNATIATNNKKNEENLNNTLNTSKQENISSATKAMKKIQIVKSKINGRGFASAAKQKRENNSLEEITESKELITKNGNNKHIDTLKEIISEISRRSGRQVQIPKHQDEKIGICH